MRDLEIFNEDKPFKKGFFMMAVLIVFTYFSPYSLEWHFVKIIDPNSDVEVIHYLIHPLA